MTYASPESPCPNIITWVLGFQHCEGYKHSAQSIKASTVYSIMQSFLPTLEYNVQMSHYHC